MAVGETMFTGLVDHCGEVLAWDGDRLRLRCRFPDLEEGESISVDGACLTVVEPTTGAFSAVLSSETRARTAAGDYGPGTRVNLERALAVGDRFGGHWVTGHVDAVTEVVAVEPSDDCVAFGFALPGAARQWVVEKGSVCLNGVSLTVNSVEKDRFWIMAIPHTQERTNLSAWKVGTRVNVEWDWMTKVVVQQVERLWASQEEKR